MNYQSTQYHPTNQGITPYTGQPVIPPPPPFCIIACLVLSKTDRLRFMGFPEQVLPAVQQTISRYWPRGIQTQGVYEGICFEYKLGGRPCTFRRLWMSPPSWSTLNGIPFGQLVSQGRNRDRKPSCQHPTLVLLLRYHFIVPTLRDPNMLLHPGTSPVSSAHRLMAAILTTLSHLGWHLYRSCDLSKKSFDKVSRPLPYNTT